MSLSARVQKLEVRRRPVGRFESQAVRDARVEQWAEELQCSPGLIERQRAEFAATGDPRHLAAFEAFLRTKDNCV